MHGKLLRFYRSGATELCENCSSQGFVPHPGNKCPAECEQVTCASSLHSAGSCANQCFGGLQTSDTFDMEANQQANPDQRPEDYLIMPA